MKYVFIFTLFLLTSCEALIKSDEDRAALHQSINQSLIQGYITEEQASAAHSAIDAASTSWSLENILSILFGIGGAYFGVRGRNMAITANRALEARGPAKPLTAEQIQILTALLNKEQKNANA